MKLLLMVPVTSFVKDPPAFPDLGIGYIANAVKKGGFTVYLRSWNMNPSIEDFKTWLKDYQPDVIGIKVFTKDVAAANETIKIIRSVNQEILIVLGGPHVSSVGPDELIEDFPFFDFAFQGEAETGFPLLLEGLSGRKTGSYLHGIPGLVWKTDGKVSSNSRMFVTDLDKLDTPLWELMDPRGYSPPQIIGGENGCLAPMVVTRGCPANCTYCSAYKINGKAVRTRSAGHVLQEIAYLYSRYNVRQINFMDTRFTHNEEVVREICEGLLSQGLRISWECVGYERLDRIDKRMLELMKRAGCRVITAGIESGSDRIRRAMKKEGTTEDIIEEIRLIKETGIAVHGFFMFGFPGESEEEMQDTIRFAFSLPLDFIHFDIVCPHPGTEALEYLKMKYNLNRMEWGIYDVTSSPFSLSEMPSDRVFKLMKRAQIKSLLKPANLFRRFRRKYIRMTGN